MKFVFTKPPPDIRPMLAEFWASVEQSLDLPLTLNLYESQFYSRDDGALDFTSTRYSVFRIPDSIFRIPSSGFRLPDSFFRIPSSFIRIPDSVFRIHFFLFNFIFFQFMLPIGRQRSRVWTQGCSTATESGAESASAQRVRQVRRR